MTVTSGNGADGEAELEEIRGRLQGTNINE